MPKLRQINLNSILLGITGRLRRRIVIAGCLGLLILCTSILVTDVRRIRSHNTGDFVHFFYAADAVYHGQDPYNAWTQGYIYPPLIAFVFQPLVPLGITHAAVVMLVVNVCVTLLAVGLAAAEFLRRLSAPRDSVVILAVMLLAMLINIDKLKGEWQMWQTDVFMLLMFVLGLTWLDRKPLLAGLVLGIAVNIKYLPIMFLPYLVIRRRWAVIAALLVSTLVFGLLPALSTGWQANLRNWGTATNGLLQMTDFRTSSSSAAEIHDVKDSLSCSITSTMARAAGNHNGLGFMLATLVAMGAMCLAAFMYHHRGLSILSTQLNKNQLLVGTEWIMLVAAVLAFGPQTNTRHLFDALIFTAAASTMMLFGQPGVGKKMLCIGVLILFLGFILPPGNRTYIGEHTPTTVWLRLGGPCWCLLIAAFSLLRATLDQANIERSISA